MNKKWNHLQFNLLDIINSFSIKGLKVGSPDCLIYEVMGEPELPITKLRKKSKVINYLYGNLNFLSENDFVIAINIDFHSNRKEIVLLNEISNWELEDWLKLSKKTGWTLNKINDVIQILGDGITIGLSQEGKVGMVSIR